MKSYSSIGQFRNVIKEVKERHDYSGKDEDGKPMYSHTTPYPTLKFRGAVKLHGTNSSVVKYSDGRLAYQSRNRELAIDDDNAGFMGYMSGLDLSSLFGDIEFNDYCAIYGEWCGGNIQKGVAISELPKMWVIFGIKADDKWVEIPMDMQNPADNIYNILQFQTFEVDVDFNTPELIQNRIIEMTTEVEDSCPVAKHFGKDGVGEGIVFTCVDDPDLRFKSKGEKHSISKVKTLNPISVEELNSINEFVEYAVTENRLEQGIAFLEENNLEVDAKSTGQFIGWVVKDVMKEEKDTIEENQLNSKRLMNAIVSKARMWFLNKV